jgi:20S proteasome alpha/beta subunit
MNAQRKFGPSAFLFAIPGELFPRIPVSEMAKTCRAEDAKSVAHKKTGLFTSCRCRRRILPGEDGPVPLEPPLPEESNHMTIGLGFTCGPLAIMSSDSEITLGGASLEGGKISSTGRRVPSGAICISLAGSASYAQVLASKIEKRFEKWTESLEKFSTWSEKTVSEFYEKHALIFVGRVDNPPTYRLLIMAAHKGQKGFWSTDRTLLVPEHAFRAVGIGESVATPLMHRLYRPYLKLNEAAILAAYVIYKVKKSVQYCGFETEIRFLCNDKFGIVPPKFITKCEGLFEKYEQLDKEFFFFAMSIPLSWPIPPPQIADKAEVPPKRGFQDVIAEAGEMRAEFSKLEVIPGNTVI